MSDAGFFIVFFFVLALLAFTAEEDGRNFLIPENFTSLSGSVTDGAYGTETVVPDNTGSHEQEETPEEYLRIELENGETVYVHEDDLRKALERRN